MKIVYLGTPEFAVKPLDAIVKSRHEVLAVVCQVDKPSGRGNKIKYPETKQYAIEHGIPVYQFEKISRDGVEILRGIKPDLMITCAYGQILSQEVLDIAPHGIINIHGSLLPKYRGAAPIQWAIINGEKQTGITILKTVKALDAGDILVEKALEIGNDETAGELFERMSLLGAEMIVDAIDSIENKTANFVPQDESKMSYFPMLKKEDFKIDFSKTAEQITNLVRGANPWPVAYFVHNGEVVKIYKTRAIQDDCRAQNGEILFCDSRNGIKIACADGMVEIMELQLPSMKKMSAKDFCNGRKLNVGVIV